MRESGADPGAENEVKFQNNPSNFLVISVKPGSYFVTIRRNQSGVEQKITEHIKFKDSGDVGLIDTGSGKWTSNAALANPSDKNSNAALGIQPPTLIGTRWVTSPEDFAVIPTIPNAAARLALAAALSEVGTYEYGDTADRERIAGYWQAVPGWTLPTVNLAWGGAFLSWVINRTNLPLPRSSAMFGPWTKWGAHIPFEQSTPGMIAIFERPGMDPKAPGGLIIGIILAKRKNCIEIVAGNIADRVVITCTLINRPVIRWII